MNPSVYAKAVASFIEDPATVLRHMLHPVASRLPLIGRLPRYTTDLVYSETEPTRQDDYITTGFAVVYGPSGIDYKIAVAQDMKTGATWFTLVWGDAAGTDTQTAPQWSTDQLFRDAAGFRRARREMRHRRTWDASLPARTDGTDADNDSATVGHPVAPDAYVFPGE